MKVIDCKGLNERNVVFCVTLPDKICRLQTGPNGAGNPKDLARATIFAADNHMSNSTKFSR